MNLKSNSKKYYESLNSMACFKEISVISPPVLANDIAKAKLMKCGDKEVCIVTVLISWIKELMNQKQFVPAA